MAKKTTRNTHLAMAPVSRIARSTGPEGTTVEADAVALVTKSAEEYIAKLFAGAYQFTKHREGKMIMKKDIEAYLKSATQ